MNLTLIEEIRFYMNRVFVCLFLSIGIITNLIVIAVNLSNEKMRAQSINIYFSAQSISDILIIICYLFQSIPDILPLSSIYCKLLMFIVFVAYTFTGYITGVVSIDRLLTSYYPARFLFKNKLKFQVMFVIVSALIISIACSTNYFSFDLIVLDETNSTIYCGYPDVYFGLINGIFMVSISGIIPIIVIFLSAILLGIKIRKVKKRINSINNRRTIRFMKIIFIYNIYFIITQVPVCAAFIISNYLISNNANFYGFLYDFTNVLSLCYNSFSLFVYLFINRIFRKRFIEMFNCYCFRK
jgi:hypothetical protein